MESNYRGINQQASLRIPQPSNCSCFNEQARRAGYMGPDGGRVQHEFFGDHHHPHPRPFLHRHDMHDAIQIEIEKERIREEIIMSEIARRRVLEAEVRRELMMERELAWLRGIDGFPYGSSPQVEFDSLARLLLLGTRAEGRSLEERIAMSLEQTKRLNGTYESGGFNTLPFQRGTADLRISEVKPVSEADKEKPKVIFLAKPDENISGPKRKAVILPGVDASELPSNVILKKKAKEEWSCALCQVSAGSEQGLNHHLQGKKHKSKEAALRARRAGNTYKIGLTKRATKSIPVVETVDLSAEQEVKFKKTREGSLKRRDLPPPVQENPISDNLKKNQSGAVQKVQKNGDHPNPDILEENKSESVRKMQKNGDPKNTNCRFWCEACKVGTSTEKNMNEHKMGKKHNQVRKSDQNGGAGQSLLEKTEVFLTHAECVAEDEKNITKANVDETMNKVRL